MKCREIQKEKDSGRGERGKGYREGGEIKKEAWQEKGIYRKRRYIDRRRRRRRRDCQSARVLYKFFFQSTSYIVKQT